MLGAPDVMQISELAVSRSALIVTVGNSVPAALEEDATIVVPTTVSMGGQVGQQPYDFSVGAILRGDCVSDGRTILKLGGLYGWDVIVARWAFDQCVKRGLGLDIALC